MNMDSMDNFEKTGNREKAIRNADSDVKRVYIETYGCQMNVNDSEIVAGILNSSGYEMTEDIAQSNVILLNTCSVRENAEAKIFKRLQHLRQFKKSNSKLIIGILGCMAERLRSKLIGREGLVSIVIGPDEYRSLPEMLRHAFEGESGIAVKLSRVETYDDIIPLRTEGISAWISIMRGCDKFCSFCIVPFTRGRERSKSMPIIVKEAKELYESGIMELTLLGQNVNSYMDTDTNANFTRLLRMVAATVPKMRIRYTTSHPYDMSDELIETMAEYENICNFIHLPVQSGSDRIIELMNRHYTAEHYLDRVKYIRKLMPNCAISTDIIAGYPSETAEDHQKTLELIKKVRFDGAFMFKYSPRENTKSWDMPDDVPEAIKQERLSEIIDLQSNIAREINLAERGNVYDVLVEGPSKKNKNEWQGRTSTNKVLIFPYSGEMIGDTVKVRVERSTSATLMGKRI